jgi:hypothetical protein
MFAMFECHFAIFSKVSFTDYDLDVEHFAGVLTYDPPHDTSVAPWFLSPRGDPRNIDETGGFHMISL